MNKSTIPLLIVVTICLIVGVGYWYFVVDAPLQTPVSTTGTLNPAQQQFETLISQLEPITFDTSIFSDPRFLSLHDLTTPIAPEPLGHIDPFAPHGGVGTSHAH